MLIPQDAERDTEPVWTWRPIEVFLSLERIDHGRPARNQSLFRLRDSNAQYNTAEKQRYNISKNFHARISMGVKSDMFLLLSQASLRD
jgi:hypothetical protein